MRGVSFGLLVAIPFWLILIGAVIVVASLIATGESTGAGLIGAVLAGAGILWVIIIHPVIEQAVDESD
ncbi:hypothetical protein [Microbacterium aurantiacum]|uniref:hypothetical protein n=1 Tax=Microbacterium aurantiacum TaxID=162393 RepID=UPI0034436C4E